MKCGMFSNKAIPPEVRARMDADRAAAELCGRLAEYAHEAWSRWMRHLFKQGRMNEDGTFTIETKAVSRWARQMQTPYTELTYEEQESDRHEACMMIALMKGVEP
jgi:hypothetical protein